LRLSQGKIYYSADFPICQQLFSNFLKKFLTGRSVDVSNFPQSLFLRKNLAKKASQKSLAEFRPPQWPEKIQILKIAGACTWRFSLLRLRTVRAQRVRGAGCILFEKMLAFSRGLGLQSCNDLCAARA
jgi:hypothetical protein